eukprot:jgi/Bigna1/74516/fgenesh1_pg.29_\
MNLRMGGLFQPCARCLLPKAGVSVVLFILLLASSCCFAATPIGRPFDGPAKVIENAIKSGAFPGAAAAIGDANGLLFARAFGRYTNDGVPPLLNNESNPEVDLETTLFDLASLTKIVATTTSVALLYQGKYLNQSTLVTDILGKEFGQNGKQGITVTHLLTHTAGFPPDPEPNYWDPKFSPEACPGNPVRTVEIQGLACANATFKSLMAQRLNTPPGQKYVYSDLSFITLGYIVGSLAETLRDSPPITPFDWSDDCVQADRDTPGGLSHAPRLLCNFAAFVARNVTSKLLSERDHVDSTSPRHRSGFFAAGFQPPQRSRKRAMPTTVPRLENIGKYTLQGQVNDGNSYAMGGIAGHAGVFATLPSLVSFARAWLFGGAPLYLNEETRHVFTTVVNGSFSSRALGWNTNGEAFDQGWNHSCGNLSSQTFMHIGYTGTQICCDPSTGIFTILLTNRVYPTDQNHMISAVRQEWNDAVMQAVSPVETRDENGGHDAPHGTGHHDSDDGDDRGGGRVRIGLEVLRDEGFSELLKKGRRIAALVDPTSVFPDSLEHVVDALAKMNVTRRERQARGKGAIASSSVPYSHSSSPIVGVLAPEHGFRGDRQAEHGDPAHYVDNATGLDVFSIYRKSAKEIREIVQGQLGATTVLVDLQDVGVRLYTFIWTFYDLLEALAPLSQSAAADDKENVAVSVIVCDRPNPLGGQVVEGPVLDLSDPSFKSRYGKLAGIPHRHGMTFGEMALMFAQHVQFNPKHLKVIAMQGGYRRSMGWRDTKLPWVPPSPNLPTPASVAAYTATVFLEATTAWEGRGTTAPFQTFGAPFLTSSQRLAGLLNSSPITCSEGVQQGEMKKKCFRAAAYNPTFFKYNGTIVPGVQWVQRPGEGDKILGPSFAMAIEILKSMQRLDVKGGFEFDGSWFGTPGPRLFDLYAGTSRLREFLEDEKDIPTSEIVHKFEFEAKQFEQFRQAYLLYP